MKIMKKKESGGLRKQFYTRYKNVKNLILYKYVKTN